MTCHVTVTAKTGPSKQVTGAVFYNVTEFNFDISRAVFSFKTNGLIKEFDLSTVATVTSVITSGDNAVVVSE